MTVSVELYTQYGCPFCDRARVLLERKGVAFTEHDAPRGSAARADALRRSGRSTVPQAFIDGHSLGGSDDLAALDQAGKLDALLGLGQHGTLDK